jgi:hypothetical protein
MARAQDPTPAWRSGFETGFPGEWLDYDNGSYTASGEPNPGMNEAWTIVDTADPLVPAGSHAYKRWPIAAQAESHRAYPGVHLDVPSPLCNSFLVYLDVDYDALEVAEWVHFATWGNNPDWQVHTMSVRDRKLEMAHLDWSYIGPSPQPDFPLRQWVRFTAYIHYQGAEVYVRVWQDGAPVLEGTYTTVAGTNLQRAHWGWYSSGSITAGVQYNDEIQIWQLSEPLSDLESEPASPYTPDPPPGGGGAGGAGTGGTSAGGQGTGATASGGSGAGAPIGGASVGGASAGGAAAPLATDDADSDCGCRQAGRARSHAGAALLALAVGVAVRRRRRCACEVR